MIDTPLPCPFCGGELQINKHFKYEMWSAIHRCKIIGPIVFDFNDDLDYIIRNWNTRIERK